MFAPGLTGTTTIEKDGEADKMYVSSLLQLATRVVCAKCNNGWMSKLETEAKPLLSRMLFDLRHATNLGKAEQNTLTFWAQKTVLMLDLSTAADYKIPKISFTSLYEQQGPVSHISVRLGWRIPKKGKYGPHLSHFTIGEVTGPEKPTMVARAGDFEVWRAVIAIGNIVFHISGSTPNVHVEVDNVDERVTPQIHPYKKDLGWPLEWPVDALTSVGVDEFSSM